MAKDVLTSKVAEGPRFENIEVDKIDLHELFAMRDLKASDVNELAENIKTVGRLINPILVRPSKKAGRFELVCGHRRLKAVKSIGWKTVPCQVRELNDEDAFAVALSENIGRSDPTPMEEARAYKRARDDFKMSLDDIAVKVGKDKSTISNRIRLLAMAPKVIQAMDEGKITPGHCEHGFMRLKNQGDQDKLLKAVLSDINYGNVVTVKDAEEKADGLNEEYEAGVKFQKFLQDNKDKIVTPRCPVCGQRPDPRQSGISANEPKFKCHAYHYPLEYWDPFKKYDKESLKASSGGLRKSKNKHENTRPNQVRNMASQYTMLEWYTFLVNKALRSKPKIKSITASQGCGYDDRGAGYSFSCYGSVEKALSEVLVYETSFHTVKSEDYYSSAERPTKEWVTVIEVRAYSRVDILKARGNILMLENEMASVLKSKREQAMVLRGTTYQNEMWRDDIHFKRGSCVPGEVLGLSCDGVKIEAIYEDLTMLVKDMKGGKEHFIQDDDVKLMATRIARKHEKDAKGTAAKEVAVPKGKPSKAKAGTCAVCGCTENDPCIDDFEETCAWANKERTLCTFCAEKKKGKAYTSTLHTNRKPHTKAKGKK